LGVYLFRGRFFLKLQLKYYLVQGDTVLGLTDS